MINSYTLDRSSILSHELSENSMTISVPTMLRDFHFLAKRAKRASKRGIKVVIRNEQGVSVNIVVMMDPDYDGPTMYNLGDGKSVTLQDIGQERESNIGHHFTTTFVVPCDPTAPHLTLTKNGYYELVPATDASTLEIVAQRIERLRRI